MPTVIYDADELPDATVCPPGGKVHVRLEFMDATIAAVVRAVADSRRRGQIYRQQSGFHRPGGAASAAYDAMKQRQ